MHSWTHFLRVGVVRAPAGVQIIGADIDQRAVEMTYRHLQVACVCVCVCVCVRVCAKARSHAHEPTRLVGWPPVRAL